ncbi:hypothetical protein F4679DRAFT_562061 [Xylaria curta]|nr:hypothetical protein F4679DRAFT_562061 [Xylaria curta]
MRQHWTSLTSKVQGSKQASILFKNLGHGLEGNVSGQTSTRGDADTDALRYQIIDTLFGLNAEFVQTWPGSLLFCDYLEESSMTLIKHKYDVIWKMIGTNDPPNLRDCWEWYFTVLSAAKNLVPENTTIDTICFQLACDKNFSITSNGVLQLTETQLDEARRAIFAVLCWTSATLVPILSRPSNPVSPESLTPALPKTWVQDSNHVLSRSDYKRPAAKVFRGFRINWADPITGMAGATFDSAFGDALFETSITYVSLYRIGHVKLKLVDTITDHLHFNRQARTLALFRFPTFCVMSILRTTKLAVMESILLELLPVRFGYASMQDPTSIYREILLSYRLLFGQSSKSRTLMKQYLHQLKRDGDYVDPFLVTLCTTPISSFHDKSSLLQEIFPNSTLDVHGRFKESSTYSAQDDFPIYGFRLQTLQRYSMRQRPSRVKDLWCDRRNPLQWYTFWTVLWIGGATIILSSLQLAVSIAQLYYAIRI